MILAVLEDVQLFSFGAAISADAFKDAFTADDCFAGHVDRAILPWHHLAIEPEIGGCLFCHVLCLRP
jgi:hypothetical protein